MKEFRFLVKIIAHNFEEKYPFILFLGSKTSLESEKDIATQVIYKFLEDYCGKPEKKEKKDGIELFYLTLSKLSESERPLHLKRYFKNIKPSLGYMYLASLIETGIFGIVITTNIDNMLEQALKDTNLDINKDYKLFVVGEDKEDRFPELFEPHNRMIKIVKLHGDIASNIIRLPLIEAVQHPNEIRETLLDVTRNNVLLVGYSDTDRDILSLLNNKGKSLYWVNRDPLDFNNKDVRRLADCFNRRESYDNQLISDYSDFDRFFQKLSEKLMELGVLIKVTEPLSDWKMVRKKTSLRTQLTLNHLSKEKYKKNVYLRRKKIEKYFKNFVTSDKAVFAIIGDSGIGKTNICCHLCESLSENQHAVLFYNGSLIPQADIAEIIIKDLRCELDLESAFKEIDHLAKEDGKKFFVFIDSINECEEPIQFLRFVNDLIGRTFQERIKIVLTCRSATWNYILRFSNTDLYWDKFCTINDEKTVEMKPLEEEEKKKMFDKYKSEYNFLNDYNRLPTSLKKRIDIPLMFDLLAKIYQDKEIPLKIDEISLFDKYYNSYIREKLSPNIEIFLNELVMYMREKKIDRISYREIYKDPLMGKLIERNEIDSPLIQLLDKSILTEISRNYIKFTYEKFFEFLLSRNIQDEFGNKLNSGRICKLLLENKEFFSMWESIKSIVVLNEDLNISRDLLGSSDPRIRGFAIDVMASLSETRPSEILSFLESIIRSGNIMEKRSALRVINKKFEKNIDIFILALRDSSPIIHEEAMKYLMRTVKKDRKKNLEMLNYFRENLVDSKGEIKKQSVRSCVECTSAIIGNFHAEKDMLYSLTTSWRSMFQDHVASKPTGLQDTLISALTQVITDLVKERFYKIFCSTKDVNYIFNLTQEEKDDFKHFVRYVTSTEKMDKRAQDLIHKYCSAGFLGAEGDLEFREYPLEISVSGVVLLVQSIYHYDTTIDFLKHLFDHGNYMLRDHVLGALTLMVITGVSQERSYNLLRELTDKLVEEYRDEIVRCMGYEQAYAPLGEIGFCQCWLDPDSKTVPYYERILDEVISQEDWEMLPTILHAIREIRMLFPEKTLTLCEKVIRAHVEDFKSLEFVKRMFSEINAIYPDLMDLFLSRNSDFLNESFSNEIRYYTDPNLSRQQSNSYTSSIYYKLLFVENLGMREEIGNILSKMVEFSSLEEFVDFTVRKAGEWLLCTRNL